MYMYDVSRKQPLEVGPREKLHIKFENIKGDEYYINHDKKVHTSVIRCFTIHTQRAGMPLGNTCERVFFSKISVLQPANAIKTKFRANGFQRFCLLFRNS